jgi:hypothetical protein
VDICFVVRHQFLHTFQIKKEKNRNLALLSPKVQKRVKLARKDLAHYKIAGKSSCWEKDAEEKDITILSMDDIDHSWFWNLQVFVHSIQNFYRWPHGDQQSLEYLSFLFVTRHIQHPSWTVILEIRKSWTNAIRVGGWGSFPKQSHFGKAVTRLVEAGISITLAFGSLQVCSVRFQNKRPYQFWQS